jgi:hypothetical protein
MRCALLLVLVLGLLSSSTAFDWKPCSDSSKYADIKEVTLTPEEPSAGVTVSFAIHGTAKIDVPAGALDISVMYSGLPIYSESRDLCDMTTCPIKTGDLTIAYDQYLPPIVPPGPYNVTLDATSSNGQELLCLEVLFDVTLPSVGAAAGAAKGKVANLLRGHNVQA